MAVCDNSGVVLSGGCRISLGCHRLHPTVLTSSLYDFQRAYK